MKRKFLSAFLCLLSLFVNAQNQWDAVTAEEVVSVVVGGGYEINNVMAGNGYKVVNNLDTPDGGFVTIYSRNCTVDLNGEAVRLGQGVSSVVACYNPINAPSHVAVILFSTVNATKMRQQIFDLGFKKTGTVKGEIVYKVPGYDFVVHESKGKSGRFPVTYFMFSPYLP